VIANRHEFVLGIWFGDYMNKDVVIRRADIQNLRTGIVAPYFMRGRTVIEDSYLRNATNVAVVTIGAPGSAPYGPAMPPKTTIIKNVGFATVDGPIGGGAQHAIAMEYDLHGGSANLVERDAVFVHGFDGVAGDDFQVFYEEQRPGFVVPQSSGNLAGSPVAGLTNAQNWAAHRVAIAGEVATGAVARAGIHGLVRDGVPAPPAPPSVPPRIARHPARQTVTAGQTATFRVAARGAALQFQWQANGVDIPGATGSSYTTPPTVVAAGGTRYRCIVSNDAGAVTSRQAALTVQR
jgi:hypothetical protein